MTCFINFVALCGEFAKLLSAKMFENLICQTLVTPNFRHLWYTIYGYAKPVGKNGCVVCRYNRVIS